MGADRRLPAHQQREDGRKKRNVQDRFEQGPAIAETRVAEPRSGFSNDQRVDDARLAPQSLGEPSNGPGWSRRRTVALAEHDVGAVDDVAPSVEDVQHGLGSGLVFGKRPQQLAAGRGRIGHPAVGQQQVELRPFHLGARGVERSSLVDGIGGRCEFADPVKQMTVVQMIFGVVGCQSERPLDRCDTRLQAIELAFSGRNQAP